MFIYVEPKITNIYANVEYFIISVIAFDDVINIRFLFMENLEFIYSRIKYIHKMNMELFINLQVNFLYQLYIHTFISEYTNTFH
mgnify:CR=1 FL=1